MIMEIGVREGMGLGTGIGILRCIAGRLVG